MARIWNTLKLAFLATLIGCFIGLLCGVLNTIPYTKKDPLPKRFLLKLLRIIIRIYVEVFRGTPMVLQSVFIYYGLPYFSNNALRFDNIFAAALLIVAINTGAYMAESVRGGIISIDPGQTCTPPAWRSLPSASTFVPLWSITPLRRTLLPKNSTGTGSRRSTWASATARAVRWCVRRTWRTKRSARCV